MLIKALTYVRRFYDRLTLGQLGVRKEETVLYRQTMPKTKGVSLRRLKNKMARLRERAAITRSNDVIERLHYVEEAIRKKERWRKKS